MNVLIGLILTLIVIIGVGFRIHNLQGGYSSYQGDKGIL